MADERDFATAWSDLLRGIDTYWQKAPFRPRIVVRQDGWGDFLSYVGGRFSPEQMTVRTDFGPADVRQTSHGPRLAFEVPAS